jgi:hypothetical protein
MTSPINILSVIKKDGYEIRKEEYSNEDYGGEGTLILEMAYTPSGDFIGDPNMAKALVEKWGIAPEKINPSFSVCTIGWAERTQKYYGWSNRAIYGFKIGDIVEEGDATSAPEGISPSESPDAKYGLPVGFIAKTKEDCRRMAIAFARSVS